LASQFNHTVFAEHSEANVGDFEVSAAAFLSRHQSVANYLTVELAVLKEMTRQLAELFGLKFPEL
jgi:hypothetical protein